MNPQFRNVLVLLILLLATAGCGGKNIAQSPESASGTQEKKLSAEELIELVSGNTITMQEYGETATIEMYSNGRLYAVKSKTEKNDGWWSTEGDMLCLKFKRWGYGDQICYDVIRDGNEYKMYTASGVGGSYFTVSPGVKNQPAGKDKPAAAGSRGTQQRTTATESPDVVVEKPAPKASTPTIQESAKPAADPQSAGRDLRMIYRDMSQNCPGCNLPGIDMNGASLIRANLAGANLKNANFSKANLKWANLKGANLAGADFAGANLAGADLAGADITRADFTGANLDQTNLRGTNISEAIGLDPKKALR